MSTFCPKLILHQSNIPKMFNNVHFLSEIQSKYQTKMDDMEVPPDLGNLHIWAMWVTVCWEKGQRSNFEVITQESNRKLTLW